jgi:hypothetical protein
MTVSITFQQFVVVAPALLACLPALLLYVRVCVCVVCARQLLQTLPILHLTGHSSSSVYIRYA